MVASELKLTELEIIGAKLIPMDFDSLSASKWLYQIIYFFLSFENHVK